MMMLRNTIDTYALKNKISINILRYYYGVIAWIQFTQK